MQVTVTVPDELLAALVPAGCNPERVIVETVALEAWRERRIAAFQLRTMLGIPSRFDLDALLKQHKIESYTAEDFEHDLANLDPIAPDSAGQPG